MKKRITWKSLVQISGLILIFLLSAQVRIFNFNQPLGRHHEWITAHTLMTLKIWEHGGGPDQYHFSPVYTFAEEGNKDIAILTGVVDKKGDAYYISYPPFGFLLPYYALKIVGAPMSANSMWIFSVLLHFIIAGLFFLLIMHISGKRISYDFYIPAWIGYILYLFSAGNLWFHSNVYFVDILMQLFFIVFLLLSFLIYERQGKVSRKLLTAFGLVTFFAIYTEWLGVFLAFAFFIFCIFNWIIRKNWNYFRIAAMISAVAICSLGLIFIQYSSIDGMEAYIKAALAKYNLRSGLSGTEGSEYGFSINNPESYSYLAEHYRNNYENVLLLLKYLILFFVPITIWKRKYFFTVNQLFVICMAASGLLLHHLIFFNFNVVHDFSTLKVGLLCFLLIVFVIDRISSFFHDISAVLHKIFWPVFSFVFIFTMYHSYALYSRINSRDMINYYNYKIGSAIFHYAENDETVFVNGACTPECMYYASRNYFFSPALQESITHLKELNRGKGIFIDIEGDAVKEIYRFNSAGDHSPIYSALDE